MPFEAGNQEAKKADHRKPKMFRDALNASLRRAFEDGVEAIQQVTDKLVAEAKAGNVVAIKEIADRIDGKVPQAIAANITNDSHEDWLERLGAAGSPTAESGPAAVLAKVSADQDENRDHNPA